MSKLTIKDIADLMGLSTSTVSRALSDHPDISEETKKKVNEVAESLHYKKNLYASFFRKKKTRLISLILPEINMFYTPQMINSINKLIAPSKYSLVISLTNDHIEKEKEIIDKCINWLVEGVIMSLSKETCDQGHIRKLKEAGIPCILLDKTIEEAIVPTVTIDNQNAAYQAVEYLIHNGHDAILGIFGSKVLSITKERITGFEKALLDYSIDQDKTEIVTVEDNHIIETVISPLLQAKKFTALFVMSDELLSQSINVVQKIGLKIPDELSVIAISDGEYPYLVFPNITHIRDSGKKMGKAATKMLLNLIENDEDVQSKIIHTKLVCLNSVRKLK
jgi:LacI family transcriptional regulator